MICFTTEGPQKFFQPTLVDDDHGGGVRNSLRKKTLLPNLGEVSPVLLCQITDISSSSFPENWSPQTKTLASRHFPEKRNSNLSSGRCGMCFLEFVGLL